MFIQKIN